MNQCRKVSVIVPNHGRDLSILKGSILHSEKSWVTAVGVDLVVIDCGLERSIQRNMGIRSAVGQYFLILDSDQSISPGLIRECAELLEQGFVAIYIPEIIVANSFFGKIRAFERTFYTGTAVDVPRFINRDFCPMFDETLNGPEDADWGNRIFPKCLITTSQNPLYHHDDISFLEYCKKKAYYSKSMKAYKAKWADDKCLNLKYRCFTVFTEKGKWKKLLRHPILTAGIIFILFIRGIIYAKSNYSHSNIQPSKPSF